MRCLGERRQFHGRRARGHEHHGKPQNRVLAEESGFGRNRGDDGDADTAES